MTSTDTGTGTTTAPATTTAPPSRAGIPFGRLLRVEARKSVNSRSAWWLLVLTAVLSVATSLFPVFLPDSAEQSLTSYTDSASSGVSLLLPVLVILLVTTEWTQRTAMTTFALEPRRSRVLTAKLTVAALLALAGAALTVVLGAAALAVSSLLGREVDWALDSGRYVGLPLSILLGVLSAFALAAVLHNTAAAIVASFAAPTVVAIASGLLRGATEYVDVFQTSTWVLAGDWSGHVAQILTSNALWLALPLWLGYLRTKRREVS